MRTRPRGGRGGGVGRYGHAHATAAVIVVSVDVAAQDTRRGCGRPLGREGWGQRSPSPRTRPRDGRGGFAHVEVTARGQTRGMSLREATGG